MSCPHCNAPLVANARFCPACGKAAVATETQAPSGTPREAPDPIVGREIAGRYRVLAKLGEGGMGAVYRGEQISLKRPVAVKLLRPELSSNDMILRRFNAEAEAVAKLNHPNTVNIYDFGRDSDGTLFIAMEFIEGRSLRKVIFQEGPLHPARALTIAAQIAASLTDAHSHSIVHRDLKPDNVMLQDRGRQRDIVRVLDFGIAKLRDDSRTTQNAMTQAGDMLGTPQYMAPEQIRGEAIDGRTDIYALGCMLYEMVTARMPFEAPTIMAMLSKHLIEHAPPPSARRPELGLPPALDHLIMTAMAKDAHTRPPSMEMFGEHIAAVLAMLPPDPNAGASRAGGSAMVPSVPSPQLTPAAFSAAPGYATPPGARFPTPPPSHVPGLQQQVPTYSTRKSRAPLYAILALLVLGGGGAGIYFATRNGGGAGNGSGSSSAEHHDDDTPKVDPDDPDDPDDDHDEHNDPGPPPVKIPDIPTAAQIDTWGSAATDTWGNAAATQTADGETLRAPGGWGFIMPAGWQGQVGPDGTITAVSDISTNATLVIVAPAPPGTVREMAKNYAASQGNLRFDIGQMMVRGKNHPRVSFFGTKQGITFVQVAVVFEDHSPRMIAFVHAPVEKFGDAQFVLFLGAVFERRVILP